MSTELKYPLMLNQVIVKDIQTGAIFIYDLHPDDLEFITNRAKKDENGNYVLSLPEIAALKRWVPKEVLEKIELQMTEINVPEFVVSMDVSNPNKKIDFADISGYTNQQLEQLLSLYGGYRAYLESQLSYYESKKSVYEATYEEALAKMLYSLSQKYEKKPVKEALHGEAIASSPQLKKLRQDCIEIDALCRRIQGLRDTYRAAYDTVSRVVALRIASKEQN